jgi:hypothetical protein
VEKTFRPRHDLGDGLGGPLEGMRALVVLHNEREDARGQIGLVGKVGDDSASR